MWRLESNEQMERGLIGAGNGVRSPPRGAKTLRNTAFFGRLSESLSEPTIPESDYVRPGRPSFEVSLPTSERVELVLDRSDVVPLEPGRGLVPRDRHRDMLRDALADRVPDGRAEQIVEERSPNLRPGTGLPPGPREVPDGLPVAVKNVGRENRLSARLILPIFPTALDDLSQGFIKREDAALAVL